MSTDIRRPRGRPPLANGVRSIELGLSLTEHDLRAVTAIAIDERVSQQEIIRRAVAKFLRDRQRTSRAKMSRSITLRRRIGI